MKTQSPSNTVAASSDGRSSADKHADFTRRTFLGGFAGTAGLAALSTPRKSRAEESEEEVFNSWERTKRYTNNEMDSGTPWVAPKRGNFDLNDPYEASLARLKVMNNLVGERTYCAMVLRCLAGTNHDPGAVMYGGYALFSWQLQVADPEKFPGVPEGTAVQRGQYTCVYVDPQTMEPVSETLNPLTGKMMPLKDYIFVEQFLWYPNGGVGFVEEPEMRDDDPNKPRMPHIKPWGDEIVLTGDGVYRNPGPHQPRFTMAMWRAPLDHIMDPQSSLGPGIYTQTGVHKAYEKPWTGFTPKDDVILSTTATGKKVHTVDDIPDTHKRLIVDRYPDRV